MIPLARCRRAVLCALGLALTFTAFCGAADPPTPSSLTVQTVPDTARPELSLPAVEVRAVQLDSRSRPEGRVLSAPVTPDGKARFSELPPGLWRVTALNHDDAGYPLDAGHVEVNLQSGDWLVIALPLDYRLAGGVVTYRGRGVSGEMALQPDPPDGRPRLHVRLSPDGRFQTSVERPGRYSAWVFAPRSGIPLTQVPKVFLSGDHATEIALPGGRLTGRLYGPDGNPRAGVRVEATLQPPADIDPEVVFLKPRTRTGADGEFSLGFLPEGTWSLTARAGAEMSRPVTVSLAAGQHLGNIVLHLSPQQP